MTTYSISLQLYFDFTPPTLANPDFDSSLKSATLPHSEKTELAIYVVGKGDKPWGAFTVDFVSRTARYRHGTQSSTADFPAYGSSSKGSDHHNAMRKALEAAEGPQVQAHFHGDEFLRQE